LTIPAVVVLVFIVAVALNASLEAGPALNLWNLYFVQKLDFTATAALTIVGCFVAVLVDYSERRPGIAGAWNVLFTPTNWRGRTDAGVLGKGTMHLARSVYSEGEFAGYLYVLYRDQANRNLLTGTCEIFLTVKGKKIAGKSTMLSGQGFAKGYLDDEDPDKGFVNRCSYDLLYESEGKLSGSVSMEFGPSVGKFEANRS